VSRADGDGSKGPAADRSDTSDPVDDDDVWTEVLPPESDTPDEADVLAEEMDEQKELTPEEQRQIALLFPGVVAERDEYLDLARRVQAEFENYKRRVDSQRADQRAQAAISLVRELLPVLDTCENAEAQGVEAIAPVHQQLTAILEKQGLNRVGDAGDDFDPNIHEAVMHEEGEGDPVVAEVLRAGYTWNDRVVRPAMVKVRG